MTTMTPRRAALVALAVYAVFVIVKLAAHRFDASVFVMAGERFCDERDTPPSLTVRHDASHDFGGYDAQFYYRFALDPTNVAKTAHGITVDNPPYRHQRLLVPIVVWALSGGGAACAVPWVFLLVELGSIAALAWLAARLAGDRGWVGLACALYPGLVISVSRDLLEPPSLALALGGLLAVRANRRGVGAVLFTLAILARETTLLVPAALLAVEVPALVRDRTRYRARAVVLAAVPVAAFVAWQAALGALVWRTVPALANRGSLRPPFVGFALFVGQAVAHAWVLDLVQAGLLVALVVAAGRALRASPLPPAEKLAWVLYVLLATTFSEAGYWSDPASYLRVSAELFVLGLVVIAANGRPPRGLVAAWGALSALWLIQAADLVAQ